MIYYITYIYIQGPARIDPTHPWCNHPVIAGANIPKGRGKKTGEDRFFNLMSHPRSAINERRLVNQFKRAMSALEYSLKESGMNYLAADRFTVADLNVASNMAWVAHLGFNSLKPYPYVQKWMYRCLYNRKYSFVYNHQIKEYHGKEMYDGIWKMFPADNNNGNNSSKL